VGAYSKDNQGMLIRLPEKIFSSDRFKLSQFAVAPYGG
jgi:hypothetical protein